METKITTVSLAAKEDKYYADKTLYQWNYGQILRIVDADLPMVVEVGFSTTEKSGDSDVRVGSTNNGVTTVAIPNKLFEEERSTDYSIYAFVYVTDENSGTTVHEIVIPVKARAKQGDPSEDPSIDPSIFKDAVNAVNASAERAETAEKSAKESADKAKEYAESARKSKEDVEKARNNAISAIGIEKESALRGIESKTVESLQKIQSQTEESQNSIKQSIADATEKKTELDGAISNAADAKGNLDKAVQSAGNAKKELDTSIGKAGEAKTALDSSIKSAGEKKLALDATVKQANTVDASLKEQIGSAEQIQANVEQIAKNKADISSLNEDLEEVKDKKITKFYASNQGETHLADSDNGKIQDMIIYGRSSQFTTTGKNLLKYPYIETTKTSQGITFTDNKDGSINVSGTATDIVYYNLYSNIDGKRLTLASGTYKLVAKGRSKCNVFVNNDVISVQNEGTFTITDGHNDVWCFIQVFKGLTVDETIYPMIQLASITDESYEPYTGGKPSPNPDYPQEIKSVENPTVKVTNEDGLKVQSVTLNNITLNAIPVSSGGNVTVGGQQYVSDYVDIERGKVVRMCGRETFNTKNGKINEEYRLAIRAGHAALDGGKKCILSAFKWTSWTTCVNGDYVYIKNIKKPNDELYTAQELKELSLDFDVVYQLLEQQETDLTAEQTQALKELASYYPVTNISVTSDQLDGYTVFNYPISMANGWDYVKKQLNDNRDYIYDMDAKTQDIDTQSAEAYVNSEYAVALTELEV